MIELQILIPLTDNNGESFQIGVITRFEQMLIKTFNGMSKLPGTIQGAWNDQGKTYRDELVIYLVFVDGIINRSKDIHRVIRFAKRNFGQLAIAVRYQGISEIL
jgi:hypothetical protein